MGNHGGYGQAFVQQQSATTWDMASRLDCLMCIEMIQAWAMPWRARRSETDGEHCALFPVYETSDNCRNSRGLCAGNRREKLGMFSPIYLQASNAMESWVKLWKAVEANTVQYVFLF